MNRFLTRLWGSKPRRPLPRRRPSPLRLEQLEDRLAPATITVTTTADEAVINGQVSLREAINSINAGADTSDVVANVTNPYGTNDTILFNVPQANPASPQPQTILVGITGLGALPQLLKPVLIDGTSEPGFSGKPLIVINGANAGANANGFDVNLGPNGPFSTGVTIQSLVINGFSGNGVLIEADNGPNPGNFDNTIRNCYVGTNPTGTTAVPNGFDGVLIDGIDSNNLGFTASNNLILGNVISGNANDGVLIEANRNGLAAGNLVCGNFIGTTATGTAALPNGQVGSPAETGSTGVEIVSASGNVVGGTSAAALTPTFFAGNVISGNAVDGVHVIGTLIDPASVNRVSANFVGVDASGLVSLGNSRFGVELSGTTGSTVGGEASGNRNVVGSNAAGIVLDNGAQNNFVQGNFVGVGADGLAQVGNKLQGIAVFSNDAAAPPLGPGQPNEPGTHNNLIGGTGPGQGNAVAFNGTGGIAVFGNPVSLSGQPNVGNAIEGNSVFLNGRRFTMVSSAPTPLLGIDLTNGFPYPREDGFTANDSKGHGAPNDPNNFQNTPVLTSAVLGSSSITITGSLSEADTPNTTYRIEFFASNPDPLGEPAEGQFFLGFANVTTGISGMASINATLSVNVTPGQIVTATATDLSAGNTSEFSAGVPTSAPPVVPASPPVVPTGTPNQLFVGKVYHDLLGRIASAAEAQGWVSLLTGGQTPGQVVLAIENAPPQEYYSGLVQGFYSSYLHRAIGPSEGLAALAYIQELARGVPIEQVRAQFTSSPEYFAVRGGGTASGFVNALYLDAFGTPNRVLTDPGAQADVNALNTGTATTASISNVVFNSPEFHFDLVQGFYQKFLGRTGSAPEINGWAGLLQHGVSDQIVIASILGSPEAFGVAQMPPTGGMPAGPPAGGMPVGPPAAVNLGPSGPNVVNGQANLNSPIFQNTALNGRADLQGVYVFRSPGDPQPPNPDAANFGNTVLAVTFSPFPGVLTPTTFDPRVTLTLNAVNVQGHLNPDFSFIITFAPPVSNAPAPGSSQVVTVNYKQGATTTLIAQYTYNTTQTIPPAAFPNNVTFPGDAIATGKFIAGAFDDPAFFDAQGFSNFALTGLNPASAAHPFPRPAPKNPSMPLPTDAKNFYGPNGNVLGFLLEVPTTKLTTANPPLLGVWATSSVNGTQVARMGRPDVGALLIPAEPRNDLTRGERRTAFNLGSPATDVANFRADLIYVLTSTKAPFQQTPARAAILADSAFGNTIVGTSTGLLPDVLTVDLSKQYLAPGNGLYNGLRPRDDSTDINFQVFENNPAFTDQVPEDNGNRITDGLFGTTPTFPYLGRPNNPPAGPNP
jgi:CSLREA domain-containing protein